MTTTLAEHQFELLATEDSVSGYAWGIGLPITDETFDPGENEWISQDSQNSRRGVNNLGRDVLAGKTWAWGSSTDATDVETAVALLDDISAAWSNPDIAETPGLYSVVRYRLAGRYRRVYGRPRRYAAPPTNLILNGYVPIDHDFTTVDAHTYDDEQSSVVVPYATSVEGGGFTLPDTLPILTLPSASGTGVSQIVVGGNARAYPVIRLNGSWTNPGVNFGDWSLKWSGEVAPGGWVEIDCRPWMLTVLNQDGASVVEGLNRSTRFEDCWFAAGSRPQVSLSGAAPGGAASAEIKWRNTWTSI